MKKMHLCEILGGKNCNPCILQNLRLVYKKMCLLPNADLISFYLRSISVSFPEGLFISKALFGLDEFTQGIKKSLGE